jgi:transcriptional repressor NrdR
VPVVEAVMRFRQENPSALGYRDAPMRCPVCTCVDDKVVDSRPSDDGVAIRRRRECLGCGNRFTTFERLEELPLVIIKRSGAREPFDRAKVAEGVRAAAKHRPVSGDAADVIAADVEEAARMLGSEVPSSEVGRLVLERLRALDDVAYMRFASVYKGFEHIDDFRREINQLAKSTEPKKRQSPDRT